MHIQQALSASILRPHSNKHQLGWKMNCHDQLNIYCVQRAVQWRRSVLASGRRGASLPSGPFISNLRRPRPRAPCPCHCPQVRAAQRSPPRSNCTDLQRRSSWTLYCRYDVAPVSEIWNNILK